MRAEAEIVLRNAREMFEDEFNTSEAFRLSSWWDSRWEETKTQWIIRAKMNEPYREGGYHFNQPKTSWYPYFKSVEEKIDWKDFRLSVCRTHTWVSPYESLFVAIGSFGAWRNQMTMGEEAEEVKAGEILPFQPKLNIITGGRGGGDDWLANLKEGAIFVSKRNDDKSPLAEQWHVQIKWGKSTILHSNYPQPQEVTILVVNQEFSQMNKLVEIILAEKQELRYD